MNHNIYHWQDERMAELKQLEIQKELEHIRLLKEAGIDDFAGLTHAVEALKTRLAKSIQRLQNHRASIHGHHRAQSHKPAH